MVEEGKITAEAVALINALEAEPPMPSYGLEEGLGGKPQVGGVEEAGRESTWAKVKGIKEQRRRRRFGVCPATGRKPKFAKNEEAADKLSRVIEERIERDVRPALANLPSFLASIPVIGEWVGQFSIVTEEREGFFGNHEVRLEIATENGAIEVEGWDEEHYRMILKKKVRGNDEQSARERAAE